MKAIKVTNDIRSKVMKAAHTTSKKRKTWKWSTCLKSAWRWAKETLLTIDGFGDYRIAKETEKAIMIFANMVCLTTDQVKSYNVWVPKSIIKDGVIPSWFIQKKQNDGRSFFSSYSGANALRLEII